jgi:hypothetical protein
MGYRRYSMNDHSYSKERVGLDDHQVLLQLSNTLIICKMGLLTWMLTGLSFICFTEKTSSNVSNKGLGIKYI